MIRIFHSDDSDNIKYAFYAKHHPRKDAKFKKGPKIKNSTKNKGHFNRKVI